MKQLVHVRSPIRVGETSVLEKDIMLDVRSWCIRLHIVPFTMPAMAKWRDKRMTLNKYRICHAFKINSLGHRAVLCLVMLHITHAVTHLALGTEGEMSPGNRTIQQHPSIHPFQNHHTFSLSAAMFFFSSVISLQSYLVIYHCFGSPLGVNYANNLMLNSRKEQRE